MTDRETVDIYLGAPALESVERDERGRFAVRVVYRDGLERLDAATESLRDALLDADRARSNLALIGYGRTRVHVDVIDEDDPERGPLDWGHLDEGEAP